MNQPQQTIFIVEDEEKVTQLLRDYLHAADYQTEFLLEGSNAVERVLEVRPDLVLLDLMLPGKDGLSICKELRQVSDIPIVMVTARVDEIDRLLGLELGADDYICKPFSPREVVIRVRNILRRVSIQNGQQGSDSSEQTTSQGEGMHTSSYRNLRLDESQFTCVFEGDPVTLTAVEFRLLFAMIKQPGRIYSRQALMDVAYQDGRVVSDRTIDTHIKNIRKKISGNSEGELIHSIYGMGYKVE